ncbi:glutamate-5-semialdehyde dehydrogenase [Rosenbergiella epipactidis]|uniref:glutamate-5-semialdehyde dehydrogenase n=1 Tax=Rosenbergiella epipactidis TaxID=1544694 RepID=UPI001BD93191|nr:glutamate-5-semialdehyde dehydrogenase [Rosenbergiella epipactidis]MBT0719548.1 glutamate-5-semialdehyde dehydrogenase [Rosenbergiella epipactidis]MCL9669550.1 glutamate-5-semialdehyde dehydrogenase [Rosenbergiella epipactidis]
MNIELMGQRAKAAAYQLATLTAQEKNQLLMTVADHLNANAADILAANQLDVADAVKQGLSPALIDRLTLTVERLADIANDVRKVCQLSDPIGQVIDGGQLDSGLKIERRRVPLGVVAIIYEARPNVTIDVATLCLKTGNAAILRGGKETYRTNAQTVEVIRKALTQHGLPIDAVQAIDDPDRQWVNQLLKLDKYVDMLIPRGGASLHKLCREHSTIPVITGGIGVCHLYVDETMDSEQALNVIVNAKKQRPSACNSLETLLIHRSQLDQFLPKFLSRMTQEGITLHLDPQLSSHPALGNQEYAQATEASYRDEWLSLDLNIKAVADLHEAVEHIREYGTQHSDGILTERYLNAQEFVNQVDSAAVYVNASTRFTDGGQFGLGAEVAVSTQKLHARGPMGLEALTTYKWICWGQNSLR